MTTPENNTEEQKKMTTQMKFKKQHYVPIQTATQIVTEMTTQMTTPDDKTR
jgi:hypothetical protein